jgi:hypothetical protein
LIFGFALERSQALLLHSLLCPRRSDVDGGDFFEKNGEKLRF